ncbi:PREDICTED: F-box/LRR-repeat protein 16-like [Branchiostoma belcheri]|uniref:F-box/LRR-repeat protein 16-like n=1 Tax=Branchiostoma belcheri TaxID=7741 RepID=A0A6P4ZYC7_BRABE|nr:PREDICTED: F-box/LRR-repeat protein 16-like [Branchiostoma belcheri]
MTKHESFMWRCAVQSRFYRLRRGERDGPGWRTRYTRSQTDCLLCCTRLCALLGRWAMEKTTDNNPTTTSPVNGVANGVPPKDMKDANANTTAKSRLPRSKRMPLLKDGLRTATEGGGTTSSTSSPEHRALLDEKILSRLFTYFWPCERCVLAQVCSKWKQVLYQPKFWREVTPILHCRELYTEGTDGEKRFVDLTSFQQRGFESACLVGVADLDICEFIDNYPPSKKTIKYISLKRSTVTDAGLEVMLEQMTSLTGLELSGCNDFSEAGLWSSLNARIVKLCISDCINVADDSLAAIAQLLPNLRELNLQAYHVTDTALSYFTTKQSHSMHTLRLRSCWETTNHGIVNIVHSLPNLTQLSLSGCSKITDDAVELIAENLKKLRSLDLSWCPRMTDASLEYIACDLHRLEELVLDRCVRITDTGLGFLSTMTSLTALYLRWCCQVQDFGLQHIYSMKKLRVLSLAGCPLLTPAGLSGLVQLKNLEELELTNCPGTTPELFQYYAQHLPHCMVIE